MKKRIAFAIAVLIVFAMLFSLISVTVVAEENTETEKSPFYNITCVYDKQSDKIKIEFRMNSAAVKKYEKSSVSVYRVSVGDTPDKMNFSTLEPRLENIVPSNRVVAEFAVESLEDRFSGYILAIRSQSGKYIVSEIFYPAIHSYQIDAGFKGIQSERADTVFYSNADSVILEIDSNRFESGSSGYLFKSGGNTYTFSSEYLDGVDSLMDLYGCMGVDVILRITPKKTDVSLKELQKTVYAYVSFMCSRYSSEQYGIAGIILGDTDFTGGMSADAYASLLYAAALAVNDAGGECGLVVPVSSNYERTTKFLDELCDSAQLSSGLSFTAMIESGINPYGITDETTDKALNKNGKDVIAADNYADFRLFLFDLSEKYGNIFINSIYHFTPDANLNEDTLNAVYVYTYLSMLFGGRVGSYIVDIDGMPEGVIDTVRYINSSRCDEEIDIDGIASVFGIKEWSKEFYKYSKKNIVAVDMKESDATDTVKGTFTGTYGYFDFSSSAGIEDWYKGIGCDGISTGKNTLGKALVARFSQGKAGRDFILHGYRYTESFRYTDFIELELMLESEAPEYTVSVNVGGEGFLYVYTSSVIKANEKEKLYIDVTDLTENNKVEYISIEINKDGDAVSDEKLYLYSVNAKSKTYSSEELTGLIEAEKERLRDSAEQLSEESKDYISAIIFIVFIVLATVVVMIMLSRKQKQDDTRKDQLL